MRALLSVSLLAAMFAACDSKITTQTDQALLDKIETVTDCFPGLYSKVDGLLEVANAWRLNASAAIANPPGLTNLAQGGSGELTFDYTFNSCTLAMTIRFYSPAGAEQNIDLSSVTTLADKIDLAATTLRTDFPSGSPFLVGDWTLSGTKGGETVTGSGALTGIIGGSTNGNELEELRTTQTTPAGGPPAVADSTITEGACSLTFRTTGLVTDNTPTQEYPIGTITMSLVGPLATVDVTITFDNTAVIQIRIDGVPGRFDFNVETNTLTQAP